MLHASLRTTLISISLAFVLVSLSTALKAQAIYVGAEQLISVGEGAVVQIVGSLENEGVVWNEGELYVNGDWLNSAQFMSSDGLTVFSGTAEQRVLHNGQAFSRLRVDNEAGISLESDITIEQEIDLVAGIVYGNSGVRVSLGAQALINGGSPESYISGTVLHRGIGDKFFPVGTDEQYLPIELLGIRGNDPQLEVQAITPHPEPGSLQDLDRVTDTHYWQLSPVGGIYEDAKFRVPLLGALEFDNNTGLVVAAAPQLGGGYLSLGSVELRGDLINGSITSKEASSFPIVTLGKSSEYSVEGEVLVPNAFAPGSPVEADRRLSVFAVNLLPDAFVFRVFNRWGQVVYETNSLDEARNQGWDGINQLTSEPAQFGVYSYYVRGVFSSGVPLEKQGTVTLFR